ncbi:MAG: hypothetical protein HY247_06005 [archaeon]|nr:MAG: hypothetical protein HY247_06005 [archaeon]
MSRLHYLYEQQGTGSERFVYYCASCSCVLRVRRELGLASETIDSLEGRCLGCGRPLEGNIECRLAPIPDDWSDIYLSAQVPVRRRQENFRPASSLPHFSLGFPRLDSMLRPLSSGSLVVLDGAPASAVAELAAFRAQLPFEQGGLDSPVLFIDGGNNSDPYLFSSFARQRRLKPATAMRRVASCRIFTFYQLADLVSKHLLRAADDYAAGLVVLSDVLGTFNEPELEEREARRILAAVDEGIAKTKKNSLVLATLGSPNKYDELVASWADTMVSFSASRGRVRAELVKHRTRPPIECTFKMSQLLRLDRRPVR